MESQRVYNPYDYANPVKDPKLFAGRGNYLSKISYLLDQAGPERGVTYLALHGPRAAGKTSLLNMTEFLAAQRNHITVRINLTTTDSTTTNFFTKLYEKLIESIGKVTDLRTADGREITPRLVRRIIGGDLIDENLPLEFPENIASSRRTSTQISDIALETDLEYLSKQADRPIVLFIDEAQEIATDEHVLSVLRTLGSSLKGYTFILAGTGDLLSRINQIFGHLLRQFEFILVERFTEISEVLDCITYPLETLGLSAEDCFANIKHTAWDLKALTDGNPYEIQLYCHAMFTRWQNSDGELKTLSPDVLDDVRRLLEAGREIQKHPQIDAVRKLNTKDLVALNMLCSSLGHATVEEIWFAHSLYKTHTLTRQELDQYQSTFIDSGLIEVTGGRINFSGDLFEEIYVRVWTITRLGESRHPQLLSHADFRHLLGRQLDYLLCDMMSSSQLWLLRTCCFGMAPKHLERGLKELSSLPQKDDIYYTVSYLHEAIMMCGIPAALDLFTITCSYNETQAVRWVYAADIDNVDLQTITSFMLATEQAAELGGDLRYEQSRIMLKSWPEILDWLASTASTKKVRNEIAERHSDAALAAYTSGDTNAAADHLRIAFRFSKSWTVANNLAYITLKNAELQESVKWGAEALALPCDPKEHALTNYNIAMTHVSKGEYIPALRYLKEAAEGMATLAFSEYQCAFLLLPEFRSNMFTLNEAPKVSLLDAINRGVELLEAAIRIERADRSMN